MGKPGTLLPVDFFGLPEMELPGRNCPGLHPDSVVSVMPVRAGDQEPEGHLGHKYFFFSSCFPNFIQWHDHSRDRGGHKVEPDLSWSPGGTTHHALWMGGDTGETQWPQQKAVYQGEGNEYLGPPSPGP